MLIVFDFTLIFLNKMAVTKTLVVFVISVFTTLAQVVLWVPSYIYMAIVLLIVKLFRKDLRKILDPIATLLDDNYTQNKTNCSMVSILKIGGDLSLQQIQNIWFNNVLQAKTVLSEGNVVLRYPELAQYPVNFLGYRFLRQDADFQIENHVLEEQNLKTEKIVRIHEKMSNKVYPEGQSPWELVIVRNYHEPDLQFAQTVQTLLILRIHHSMGDGISVVKLLVEGLGQKKLTAATSSHTKQSYWDQISFYLSLPYNITRVNQQFLSHIIKQRHPWCVKDVYNDQSQIHTAFSEKIPKHVLKLIAVKKKVRASAVLLLIITNTIRRFQKKNGETCDEGLLVHCLLPKADHPDFLRNHLHIGLPKLPVDESCKNLRLQKCEDIYNKLRSSPIPRAAEIVTTLVSTWVGGMRSSLTAVRGVSTVVSNIAGEEVGFSVGSYPCTDFTMTVVGFRPSSVGVQFLALSYKDSLQFSIQTKASVMDDNATNQLADMIGMECDKLLDTVSVLEI